MGGTTQSLGASKQRRVSEIPEGQILAGMTKLHSCLLAYELKGSRIFSIPVI